MTWFFKLYKPDRFAFGGNLSSLGLFTKFWLLTRGR